MLLILDGWGLSENTSGNAVHLAHTPNFDDLWNNWPHTKLVASGEDVGLPAGVMGNSEVGHLNIGAGRIVWQDSSLIDQSIRDGSFYENENLLAAMRAAKAKNKRVHLIGLVSDGNVHSSEGHYFALLEMAAREGLLGDRVLVHAFTDGRDVAPDSAPQHIARLLAQMVSTGAGAIASIIGRYYAMDRDHRWGRTRRAYELLIEGKGHVAPDAMAAIEMAYARGETDEFIEETVILAPDGKPRPRIEDGDSVIFFNYRSDRGRQLTRAFIEDDFDADVSNLEDLKSEDERTRAKWQREVRPGVLWTTMTRYAADILCPIAFEPRPQRDGIGEIVSKHGKTQLRAAETEKYPHVTYFFSGGIETEWPGEERILVNSPKVATYDLQPQMSAPELTQKVCAAIRSEEFDFIVTNFANPDMVGHTGVLPAAISAVETADKSLGEIVAAIKETGGALLVLADHGNCEQMIDPQTGGPHTAHTTNLVPCILFGAGLENEILRQSESGAGGRLADVAPTLLGLLHLPQPAAMTGIDLRRAADERFVNGMTEAGSTPALKELQALQKLLAGAARQDGSTLHLSEVRAALGQAARDAAKIIEE
jgi:2,3-bisphosphoglycerate-independent phosphoglycerate mutase